MNKRIRRKKRVGEFRVNGFAIEGTMSEALAAEESAILLDRFLDDAFAQFDPMQICLSFAGWNNFTILLESRQDPRFRKAARRLTQSEADLVVEWFRARPEIKEITKTEWIHDLWN